MNSIEVCVFSVFWVRVWFNLQVRVLEVTFNILRIKPFCNDKNIHPSEKS